MTTTKKKTTKVTKATKPEVKAVDKLKNDLMNQPSSFSVSDKRKYKSLTESIVKEFHKAENSYLNIAFKLHEIWLKDLYKIDNFQNIYDFAFHNFGIAQGTCSDYINIVKKFGECVASEDNTVTYTGKLKPEFDKFTSSKLMVMLKLPDEILATLTPDMTVRTLKAIKREYQDSKSAIEEQDENVVDSTAEEVSSDPVDAESEEDLELTKDEKKAKSVRLAMVDDVLHLPEDVQESIVMAWTDFCKKYPDKKVQFDISLVW